MKIAQIAPLTESVPPKFYGGTERIVSYLTEELVRRGHDVTLFASGDSRTSAELVACCDVALRLNQKAQNPIPYHVMMLEEVRRRANEFDVLHFHVDVLHFPIIREFAQRTVTTLHGRLDLPDLAQLYAMFNDIPLVSISDDQRRPMPPVNWLGTVYHGLPNDILPFRPKASGYLAFLGRISPEKGPEAAIEIAARVGMPLKIAAKIDAVDRSFWSGKVEPQVLRHSNVEFIGEIDERAKAEFLGNATALLFPIDWPEPFGLVTIEAMACGTPVVAFNRGAVPEVIDHGVSGLIVESIDEAVEAVRRIGSLDRARVRKTFETRFTVGRMCSDYLGIYSLLACDEQFPLGPRNGFAANAAEIASTA
ncbi:glycosyltransferase family 4 protein [Mesorhizobium sp. CA9]|uniref:glycosyltransferase family 4 protein n=1 Tax=unclassified Mesorhizobium TaxID=325217 RepID=UPI001CCD622B|nr:MULTISPECIES: glycosyltransferase family 4 protein [unclassified Mesorhizobium]MBZ9733317.1 glycosyltransferase family 4 protein [Mesorhizobium sp. CA9]MBZ9833037.1 glycosyltransferase family 4 protein [Mesorhizobium sp. CA2]MBZ9835173.1 glycosyltransferase family 4 protein [Mesorhizobium sp. CA3]MBZ9876143.1 glycosyltransferase family 4 protein [Mesorhizobium sp. Ca11]MBZ9900478.1 glycosyltransferase family 4 protein [Mesorhizobium sp. CA17]